MTNLQAAEVLRSQLNQDKRIPFLAAAVRDAYEKAITALEHQPEPQVMEPAPQYCDDCGECGGS